MRIFGPAIRRLFLLLDAEDDQTVGRESNIADDQRAFIDRAFRSVGERVLVATGSVASGYFGPDHPPLDALIIGSLDETNGEGQS